MNTSAKKITAACYIGFLIYLLGFYSHKNIFGKIFIYFDILWQIANPILTFKITIGSLTLLLFFFIFALKGNIVCKFLCPWGRVLYLLPGSRKQRATNKLNGYITYFVILSLLFNFNPLLFVDPFVFFVQTSAFLNGNIPITLMLPATITLILNAVKKQFWCHNVCPMGFLLNKITKYAATLKKSNAPLKSDIDISRRQFIIGGAGLITAVSTKNIFVKNLALKTSRLRPPSAIKEETFRKKCIRCGACISVCPTNALQPTLAAGFMTPMLVPKKGYCSEFCNDCTKICPTGAIAPISLAKKRKFKIGTAAVNDKQCLCFTKKTLCLLCVESCPYHAISTITIDNVRVPVVDSSICIGCGKCENKCPVNPISAIKIFK